MMTKEEKEIQRDLDFQRKLRELKQSPVKAEGYTSPLNQEINRVKGNIPINSTEKFVVPKGNPHIKTNEAIAVIGGVTDKFNTNSVQKVSGISEWAKKIADSRAASKLAKMAGGAGTMLKAAGKRIPMIGGIASGIGTALMTGDASAALPEMVPLINEAEGVGPTEGTLEHSLESGNRMTPQEMEILRNRFNK